MATKKKQLELQIQPKLCANFIVQAFEKVGEYGSMNQKQGVFFGNYKYYYQEVLVHIILRGNKDKSFLQIVGKTDDLVGTGAKIAIDKLIECLSEMEQKYIIESSVEKGFKYALSNQYDKAKTELQKVELKKTKDFKILFGLGLCYLNEKNNEKAKEYITDALNTTDEKNNKLVLTRRVSKKLFDLKEYQFASEILEEIGNDANADNKDKLFYLLLLLHSRNFEKLIFQLTKAFPLSRSYVPQITNDPSVSLELKKEFIKHLPILIKAIRKKTIFNVMPQSILYLLQVDKTEIPKEYRRLLKNFYQNKQFDIAQLGKCFDELKLKIEESEREARIHLSNERSHTINKIANKANHLNVISQSQLNELMDNRFLKLTEKVESFGVQLSESKNFKEYFITINNSHELEKELNEYFENLKNQFPIFIQQSIDKSNSKNAKKLISLHTTLYGTNLENQKIFDIEIQRIDSERSKRLKKIIIISLVSFTLIALISILIPDEDNTAKTVENKINNSQNTSKNKTPENVRKEIKKPTELSLEVETPSIRKSLDEFYNYAYQKDLQSLMNCYRFPITYYSNTTASFDEVEKIYINSWNKKIFSQNTILDLMEINDYSCIVKVNYVWRNKDGSEGEIESYIKFVFDSEYKIVSQTPADNMDFETAVNNSSTSINQFSQCNNCGYDVCNNDCASYYDYTNYEIDEIKIGNYIWMTKNLNVTRFRNGDIIPHAKTKEQWIKAKIDKKPAWCDVNNSKENGKIFGKLYNWYAVNDPRGVCPQGWKIPTEIEWKNLSETYYLSKEKDGSNEFSRVVGSSPYSDIFKFYGKYRTVNGYFANDERTQNWWAIDEDGITAWSKGNYKSNKDVFSKSHRTPDKGAGYFIRCVKD